MGPATADDAIEPETVMETRDVLDPMAGDKLPAVRAVRGAEVRELRITKRLLEKFGHTDECAGCTHSRLGMQQRPHTLQCRTRIYLAMQVDEDEQERLGKFLDKMPPPPSDPGLQRGNVEEEADNLFARDTENDRTPFSEQRLAVGIGCGYRLWIQAAEIGCGSASSRHAMAPFLRVWGYESRRGLVVLDSRFDSPQRRTL
jgi:hypothetical protein